MKELLNGEESLVTAFWFVGIGYVLLSSGFLALAVRADSKLVLVFALIFTAIFFVFYQISVWKCSDNCSWIGWANLARIVVVIRTVSFPISFFLNVFISSEYAKTINVYSNALEITISLIVFSAFLYFKVSGKSLTRPESTGVASVISNTNYIKDAKAKFLAGDYEGALALFNTADSIEKLDESSKSFQTMCLRRLKKRNPAV